jgi:hypothetical protein
MVLVWKDAKSFRRHLETMRTFRQSHGRFLSDRPLLMEMPIPDYARFSRRDERITCLADSKGDEILPPIWKIEVPPGSQN